MVIVSQLLLYLCLSLLMGVMLGNSVFAGHMPKFRVPKWLLISSAAGVKSRQMYRTAICH